MSEGGVGVLKNNNVVFKRHGLRPRAMFKIQAGLFRTLRRATGALFKIRHALFKNQNPLFKSR